MEDCKSFISLDAATLNQHERFLNSTLSEAQDENREIQITRKWRWNKPVIMKAFEKVV